MREEPPMISASHSPATDNDVEAWLQPIPESQRTHKVSGQFWIWAGANLAPINWVLGTLGPIFGLSLVETILVVVIGNLVGCALFGLFATMGHKTGVNQMVLSRSAFGRRGAYIPSAAQLLLTMGWIGVNTWVILDLVVGESGILDKLGYHGGQGTRYVVGLLIMLVQVVIAIWGFIEVDNGFGALLDIIPVNNEDNFLHLILGLTGLAAGAATPAVSRPPEAEPA